jgi:hypothetical protein
MLDSSAMTVAGLLGGLAMVFASASPSTSGRPAMDAAVVHPDAPPPGHTGGYGEPTCQICHAEYPLDTDAIRVAIMGVPQVAAPESVHRVAVLVRAEGTIAAGFQLSTRTPDGRQAGRIRPVDDQVTITLGDTPAGEVEFAHQTAIGMGGEERVEAMWTVEWTAPADPTDVTWSVSGNSGNGDNSPFGDLVGTGSAGTRVR